MKQAIKQTDISDRLANKCKIFVSRNGVLRYGDTTPDGEIIDPTAGQFQGVACSYVPWTPDEEVRLGKCMNCGAEIWGVVDTLDSQPRMSACDERCEAELAAWIDGSQQAQEEMFGFDEFDMFNEEEIL